MSNIVKHAVGEIRSIIGNAALASYKGKALPALIPNGFTVEIPADTSLGDFICNAPVINAEKMNMPSIKIAEIIKENCVFDGEYIDSCTAGSTGTLYFKATDKWFCNIMHDVMACVDSYGRSLYGKGKKVLVLVSSSDKPTLNDLRCRAVADCIARTMTLSAYRVTTENHMLSDKAEENASYCRNRIADDAFEKIICVSPSVDEKYISDLKAVLCAGGISEDFLDIVPVEPVHTYDDNAAVSAISENKNENAIKFIFNTDTADKVTELAPDFLEQNEFISVQRVYSEICGKINTLTANGISLNDDISDEALSLLSSNEEKELIRHIGQYTNVITDIAKTYNTVLITKYLIKLASLFTTFSKAKPLANDNAQLTQARLSLYRCAEITFKDALSALTIDVQ